MQKKAYMYCSVAMVGWGSMFIAAKLAFTAISGLLLLFFRYLIEFCRDDRCSNRRKEIDGK